MVCSQLFETAGKLSNHACITKTEEEDEDQNEQKYLRNTEKNAEKCEKCDFVGKNATHLNNHVKKMHPIKCSQCESKFTTQHKLRLHLLKEHKIGKDQERCLCSLCGKTLVGRSNFKKHEREKHGIDNIYRKRIVKPLKINCSKCSASFETVSQLNDHATICEDVSHNFTCPSCPLIWCSGPVLNLHLKADHKIQGKL